MKINLTAKIVAAFLSLAVAFAGAASSRNFAEFVADDTLIANADRSNELATEAYAIDLGLTCQSAVLMEASTGKVLYAHNESEALPPASVTKVMTLLLIMEAIDSGTIGYSDMVTASANAASMGGSQIYLKEGERMSVDDLLKSIVIASANDAAVALAEHIAGSEEAFVTKMNERATELGMKSTNFENTNGLDDTTEEHLTSALDIAIMSRELIKHKKILEYSSTWMDTIRDGSFGLTNTNRLIRFYQGATGLKTGSTSKAGFCISATANKNGMELICVIMAAETRDIRNAEAKTLLDWGYSNYELYKCNAEALGEMRVEGSNDCVIDVTGGEFSCVVRKGSASKIQKKTEIFSSVAAPLKKGDKIGNITLTLGEEVVGNIDVVSGENVDRIGYLQIFTKMIKSFFLSA